MSLESLAKWRDGRARPPFWPLVKLASEAKVSLKWLATGDGPMEEQDADVSPPPRLSKSLDLNRLVVAYEEALERIPDANGRDSDALMELTLLLYDSLTVSAAATKARPAEVAARTSRSKGEG